MQKLITEDFIADKNLLISTISLLADSYLNPEMVLETALSKSDTIYFYSEDNLVNAIAFSKRIKLRKYPKEQIVYLGMTAARKLSKKGLAFQLVRKRLKDISEIISKDENLYAVSTISTPFTYNYYRRITKELYPTTNGIIPTFISSFFTCICTEVLHQNGMNEHDWLLKSYTLTRYRNEETERIITYLNSNYLYLFDQVHFDLCKGDRLVLLGIVDIEKLIV